LEEIKEELPFFGYFWWILSGCLFINIKLARMEKSPETGIKKWKDEKEKVIDEGKHVIVNSQMVLKASKVFDKIP